MAARVRKRNPKDPKSKWIVDYFDNEGRRSQVTRETRKAAVAEKLRIDIEVVERRHIARSRALTIAELCEKYFAHCEQKITDGRLTKATVVNVKTSLRRTIIPALGRILIVDLRAADVEEVYNRAVQSGILKPIVARQRIAMLKRVQDFANKRDLAKTRVVDDALSELRGVRSDSIERFTLAQVQMLLAAAGDHRRRCAARLTIMGNIFVHMAPLCGMRYGEIAGLTAANVDFANGRICIRHSYSVYDGLKGPKSRAGLRDYPMPAPIPDMLRAWIDNHRIENPLDLLFTSREGGPFPNGNFHTRYWQPLMRRLGFRDDGPGKRYHFHALRHFSASMLCVEMPLNDVPALLGHRTLDTTLQVYAHGIATPDARAAAVQSAANKMVARSLVAV